MAAQRTGERSGTCGAAKVRSNALACGATLHDFQTGHLHQSDEASADGQPVDEWKQASPRTTRPDTSEEKGREEGLLEQAHRPRRPTNDAHPTDVVGEERRENRGEETRQHGDRDERHTSVATCTRRDHTEAHNRNPSHECFCWLKAEVPHRVPDCNAGDEAAQPDHRYEMLSDFALAGSGTVMPRDRPVSPHS